MRPLAPHDPSRPRHRALARGVVVLAACAACVTPTALVRAEWGGGSSAMGGFASAIERGVVTVQEGMISWYGQAFNDRKTASGERFDANEMTMAHPTLPFGTQVRVTNLRNGRSVVVRVNDRGPFVRSRIADLSQAAAASIGMMRRGIARVRLEVLEATSPSGKVED
jgi:rare lipoprotein A